MSRCEDSEPPLPPRFARSPFPALGAGKDSGVAPRDET